MTASTGKIRSSLGTGLIIFLLTLASIAGAATPARGDVITIVGTASLSLTSSGGEQQVSLDFLNPVLATPTVDGVFSPEIIPFVTLGSIGDLQFDTAGLVGAPVNPFLTIGGYTFSVTSALAGNTFGPLSLTGTPTGTTLSFTVLGNVTGGNFGASSQPFSGVFNSMLPGETPAEVFDSLAQSRNVGFTATLTTTQVPEPASLFLFGSAFGAAGLRQWRQKRKLTGRIGRN